MIPPPKELTAFPALKPVKPKTPVQGGGGLRKRWKDETGNIYEWDSQHGTVEKYNKRENIWVSLTQTRVRYSKVRIKLARWNPNHQELIKCHQQLDVSSGRMKKAEKLYFKNCL